MEIDWVKEGPSMVGALLMLLACAYLGGATLVNMIQERHQGVGPRKYAPPADVSVLDHQTPS